MKKKIVRVLTFIFAVMLVFSFAACGDKTASTDTTGTEDNGSKNNGSGDTGDKVEATPEPTATPEIVLDLGGRGIRYAMWWTTTDPERGKSESGDLAADKMDAIKAKYNFYFDYINNDWTSHHDLMGTSVMAGDPFADICWMENKFFYPGMVGKQCIQPVDTFEYFNFTDSKWNRLINEGSFYKGHQYSAQTGSPGGNSVFMFYNKTMLAKENILDVHDLFINKKWTWDKWLEYMIKTTQDTDSDGVTDQFGFSAYRFDAPFIYSNNGEIASFDENGKINFVMNDPNTLEALTFMVDMETKYKVWYEGDDYSQWREVGAQGFDANTVAFFAGPQWQASNHFAKTMTDDYGIVLVPMGPKASDYYCVQNEGNMIVFLANIPKPEEVAFIWNIHTDPIPDVPKEWTGLENISRDDDSLEVLKGVALYDYQSKQSNAFVIGRLWDKVIGNCIVPMRKGEKSPSAAIEEVTPEITTLIEDMYTQIGD